MKNIRNTPRILPIGGATCLAILCIGTAQAQRGPGGPEGRQGPPPFLQGIGDQFAAVAKADVNNDQQIDADEQAALVASIEAGDFEMPERGPRGPRGEEADRPERGPRGENADRPQRGPRGENADRPQRGPRGENADRPQRGPRGENADRPQRGPRGEQAQRPQRGPGGAQAQRPQRGPGGERPQRPEGVPGERPDANPERIAERMAAMYNAFAQYDADANGSLNEDEVESLMDALRNGDIDLPRGPGRPDVSERPDTDRPQRGRGAPQDREGQRGPRGPRGGR